MKDNKQDMLNLINDYMITHAKLLSYAEDVHDTMQIRIHQNKLKSGEWAKEMLEL